eukprot:jgi/Botrbrau1/21602/Bobra.43_1s0010.2
MMNVPLTYVNYRIRGDYRLCTHVDYSVSSSIRGATRVSTGKGCVKRTKASSHGGRLLRLRSSTDGEVATTSEPPPAVRVATKEEDGASNNGPGPGAIEVDTSDSELTYVAPSDARKFLTWWKLQWALPWRRFSEKSVLILELGGDIPEKRTGRFGDGKSIAQITSSLQKAALDYRIEGIFLKISPLSVGWAKLQEIAKYIAYFRASGKWSIAFFDRGGEKEYFLASCCAEVFVPPSGNLFLRGLAVQGTFLRGVFEKVGVEPQIKRIGKYKSAGDQLLRKDMSDAQREQLTALLDDFYSGFVEHVANVRGKSVAEVEEMLNKGLYKMEDYRTGGWVTDLKYDDEVQDLLRERTGGKDDDVQAVALKKYAFVSRSAFGLYGNKKIAVLRASGAIVGGQGFGDGTITADKIVDQLRSLAKNKRIAAVVLRVDSPGGDALASDIMWREIQKLREKKPVIASMSDVAASGGYYMAMACEKIVAERLTITGSIGVVTGKFNLQDLYQRVGYAKTFISKGKYAELLVDNRPFSDEELQLFDQNAEYAYETFRNKAAESRKMSVESMQDVAQGRVWSGQRALAVGLVDAIGGLPRAVQLARTAANIDPNEDVSVVEVSAQGAPSPLKLLSGASILHAFLQAQIGGASGGASLATALVKSFNDGAGLSATLLLLASKKPVALMPDIEVLGANELQ